MHKVTIVTLGPGPKDLLTLGAAAQMKKAGKLILRTARHGAAVFLEEENIPYESLDALHETSDDFDAFMKAAADRVLEAAKQRAVTYAVADPAQDATVSRLKAIAGDRLVIMPGVSLAGALVSQALPDGPFMVSSATNLKTVNAQQPLCVVELNSRALAGTVKLTLLQTYGENAGLLFFPPASCVTRKSVPLTLPDLDRQPRYDHTAGFIIFPVPLLHRTRFDPEDLLAIMRRLRAPDGCPWDREQTHQSLAKYLVEEANEAACALLEEDWAHVAEELGDVFLQLAFHATVGYEYGTFGWGDMLEAICGKLIRRHPHVFGEMKLNTSGEVLKSWDAIKKAERGEDANSSVSENMTAVSRGMAPLLRAEKVQKTASGAGFDWDNALEALQKVHEEADELQHELKTSGKAMEELGDLLFSCVNTARLMGVSAGEALHLATEKFIKRFIWIEKETKKDKKRLNMLTGNELGVYWNRSKMKVK